MVQRAIAFDSFYNMAEINALIFNQGGIHRLTSDQMEKADKDTIATFKKTCYQHAHTAINRMLVQLEEWAQSLNPATTPDETENTPEEDLTDEEIKAAADEQAIADIVALWKVSRYYYLANGLFINTATKFNEYVDIYANREKFVSLQPDLQIGRASCRERVSSPV